MSDPPVRQIATKCKYCGKSPLCRIPFDQTKFVCADCLFDNPEYTKDWLESSPQFLRDTYKDMPIENI